MDDNELHWLAGLLEGEGSFLAPPPSDPNTPRIQIEMTDEDVIGRVATLFGVNFTTIRRSGNYATKWKPGYYVALKGKRAVELMQKLRPLMGKRRQGQIDRAIATYHLREHPTNNAKLSEEQVLQIYHRAHDGEHPRKIAADYSISRCTVSDIKRGKSWSWVTGARGKPKDDV